MQSEYEGDERARPARGGDAAQDRVEQDRAECVKQNVGQMVRAGIQAVDLNADEVRDPGERKPVGGVKGAKGPDDRLRREAAADVRIVGDEIGIVVVNEIEMANLEINGDNCQQQGEANGAILAIELGWRTRHALRRSLRGRRWRFQPSLIRRRGPAWRGCRNRCAGRDRGPTRRRRR